MKPENIPAELRELSQWVLWKYETRNGNATKIPMTCLGRSASSTNPATWTNFNQAWNNRELYDGIGFVFAKDGGLCGVDLDGCRNPATGEISEWAKLIIKRIGSYAEVSPSDTGVKVFCRGSNPFGAGRKIQIETPKVCDKEPAIECYDVGRYFAVTGKRLNGMWSIVNADLGWLLDQYEHKRVPVFAPMKASLLDRARKYLLKLPPSISGCGGHNAAFRAACVLVLGFGLPDTDAMTLLSEWNRLCQPPWSEKELAHKIRSAMQQPGERNYLRDAREDQWQSIAVPAYRQSEESEERTRTTTLRKAVSKVVDNLEKNVELVSTGLSDLDYAVGGGLDWGELVVLAARPSHGKSAVALQIIHEATAGGTPCLMVSEEMSDIAIGKRTIQFISDMNSEQWKTRSGELCEQIDAHFEHRAECFIAESCATVVETCKQIEHHVKENGVKIVAVDYAQLLTTAGKSRYEQVTNASIELRKITSRLGIITLMLCQLGREIEKRNPFVPHMADLKESGQIEQDADVIVFLVWPWRVDSNNTKNKYEFFIGKNRNRPINQHCVECLFEPERQRIRLVSAGRYRTEFAEFDN